jgi:pyruvate,water dikinase
VAVRSSATAEDLPGASFAGQQETFLHIKGLDKLCAAIRNSMASLFTSRAIIYRQEKGFDHMKVGLSVGVQKMVRADKGVSGVAFSLDTETGNKDIVLINASYGLGEAIVQGIVTPDEYMVHKPTLIQGFAPIIKKQRGDKHSAIVYSAKKSKEPTNIIKIAKSKQNAFALSDTQILDLAKQIITIESYYSTKNNRWTPMDIEWAYDGMDGQLYILQARPETIYAIKADQLPTITYYTCSDSTIRPLLTGISIGTGISQGTVRIVDSIAHIDRIQKGDIIVTAMTNPDWVPALKRAAGIITQQGGRTCHAAIVSRELGITAIIGVSNAMRLLQNDQKVTLDCSHGSIGYVYDSFVPFKQHTIPYTHVSKPPVSILVNIANPDSALRVVQLPVDGVGLARIEFIISTYIRIHPLALLYPDVISKKMNTTIAHITAAYKDAKTFFIDTLAYGIGMIAAALYPKKVIVRTSDFKTNEYRNLIGGIYFEPEEENPMLGLRGASRYYHTKYQEAFALECAAIKKVRDTMGLRNMQIMIPFVRTITEATKVIAILHESGLVRGEHNLEYWMMCELPSNVLLMDQFAQYFDGFSIGSNDLTQLILGVDRDSTYLASLFDERDYAVKLAIAQAIEAAHKAGKPIGICGQAPSDYSEFAAYCIKQGIDSISLNTDAVMPFLMHYTQ